MKKTLLFLILLCSYLLFFRLGKRPLLSSGEPRASEIAVEMLLRKNFLIPYLNEEIILTKPPLFHWLIIVAYKLFGVNEFASRFFGVVSGIVVCMVAYLFGVKFWNDRAGTKAGIILLLSPQFFWNIRCARIDAVLLAFFTLSLFFFWKGYETRKKVYMYLWFAFSGLGFLAKGHVALLTLLIPILFLQQIKKIDFIKKIPWIKGILLFLLIVLPWYVYIFFAVAEKKATMFFLQQNFAWLLGRGWYKVFSYIPNLFLGIFPWSLLIFPMVLISWREFRDKDEKIVFLYIWAITVFIIFSLLGKKVTRYILPMYLPIALLIGGYWESIIQRRIWVRLIFYLYILLGIILLFMLYFCPFYTQWIGPYLRFLLEEYFISEKILLSVSILSIIIILVLTFNRKKLWFFITSCVQIYFILTYTIVGGLIERDYYSPKPFCSVMKVIIPEGAPVYAVDSWDNSIRYYFGRHVTVLRGKEEFKKILEKKGHSFFLMWEDVFEKLPEEVKSKLKVVLKGYKVREHKVVLLEKNGRGQ